MEKPDFDSIKETYEKYYAWAVANHDDRLPDVEDWYSKLNEVQLNLYQDIKYIGLRMYPLYPIGRYFIDFGNPFKKIGLEILYKNHGLAEKQERFDFFKADGWTIFTIQSKDTYLTAQQLFDLNIDKYNVSVLDELDAEDWLKFINDNKATNSQCLIHFIRSEYFTPPPDED